MSNSTSNSSGISEIGFVGLLTCIFITLKLLGKIAWSWWWVLSPLWISTGLVIAILLVIEIIWFIVFIVENNKKAK